MRVSKKQREANEKEGMQLIVMLVIAAGLFFMVLNMALAAPVILLCGLLLNWHDTQLLRNHLIAMGDADEGGQDEAARRNTAKYKLLLKAIFKKGEGLPRRSDGLFAERSDLARELNAQIRRILLHINAEDDESDDEDAWGDYEHEQRRLRIQRHVLQSLLAGYGVALFVGGLLWSAHLTWLAAGWGSLILYLFAVLLVVPERYREQAPERESDIYHQ